MYDGRTVWYKVKNPEYSQAAGRQERFVSSRGYNDIKHVKELAKEAKAPKSHLPTNSHQLWPPAAKTGVAYQESFVLRDPLLSAASATSGRERKGHPAAL